MSYLLQCWNTDSLENKYLQKRRNSAEGADLGDAVECEEPKCVTPVLPREMYFVILSFLPPNDLCSIARVNKEFKALVMDNMLWKIMYARRWLWKASDNFMSKNYPKDFEWREMFRTRLLVEKKYLHEVVDELSRRNRPERANCNDNQDWRTYLRRGKLLAKYTTEDLQEFLMLAAVEQEQYKTAAVLALSSSDKGKHETADIYYYWGRCIKDLSRNAVGVDKHNYLLEEQEKYQIAASIEPKDSYILYSWAINLRFQLETLEGEEAVTTYRESSKKYRAALKFGYIEKYVLWGLGSLKLHMAKKQICSNNLDAALLYLEKSLKKYASLQVLWEEGDVLTAFSLCFNTSCIHSCRMKINQLRGNSDLYQLERKQCIDQLQECHARKDYMEYLTLDLLDLWYFDEFRNESWFSEIYAKSKPKKLSATW